MHSKEAEDQYDKLRCTFSLQPHHLNRASKIAVQRLMSREKTAAGCRAASILHHKTYNTLEIFPESVIIRHQLNL